MAGEVLIIDYFGAALNIVCQQADRGPSTLIGEEQRAWSGRLISQVRGEKRTWQFRTTFLPTEIKEVIERITARRLQVYYAGEALQLNPVIDPFRLDNPTWLRTTMTATPAVADPYNGKNALTLTATGTNADIRQVSSGMAIPRINNIWLRRRTGSGGITLINPDGVALTSAPISTTWQRYPSAQQTSVARYIGLQIAVSGDSIDVYNPVMTSDPVLCSLNITGERMQAGSLLWELGLALTEA